MIRGFEYINNSHCKVYLPFTNSATENKAKGASHIVTNNGVSIRTLSDYSIPNCPNGAKKAAYFDGSSYLTIPYSDDFDYFGKEPLTYKFWVYITAGSHLEGFFGMYKDSDNSFLFFMDAQAGFPINLFFSGDISGTPFEISNNNKQLAINTWTLIELTLFNTRGGSGNNYSYINAIGDISTSNEIKRVTALNEVLKIGQNANPSPEYITGYMSEFQIFKGLARPRPGTYNPTNNQKYYTLSTKML